ncbi:MAG: hypothetical protein WC865_16795 [Bacteroidales bacterium]
MAQANKLNYENKNRARNPDYRIHDDQPNVQKVVVSGSDLGLSGKFKVRDAWRQSDIGEFNGSFETEVPFHGVMLYRIFPGK